MAGRRTNLALLWGLVLAIVTGVAAFIVGTPTGRWVVVAHGAMGLCLLVLTPWKSVIARRGLARRRSGRVTSIVLALAVVVTLASGISLITGLVPNIGPFTSMQVHVGSGVLAAALTLIHATQRPVSGRLDLGRRDSLRLIGLGTAAFAVWAALEGSLDVIGVRGGGRRFTGSHEIAEASAVPPTQWLNDSVQHLDSATHLVMVDGVSFEVADLMGIDQLEATLDCTGGWYTTQEFSGTRLDRLITSTGRSIFVRSVTGYWRRFPREHADRLLLATHMAGAPLPDGNGGPVRLVAPSRRGYWWVKWVDLVAVDDRPAWWQPPLPAA